MLMDSSRTTADVATIAPKNRAMDATSCPRPGRRPRSIIGASVVIFIMAMLQFLGTPAMGAFEYGEPIEVLVSAGDNLTLTFEGDTADAVAVSFQQCSGSEYMSMEIYYDLYSLRSGTLSSNTCHRIVGAGTSFDDSALDYDNLCAFQSSGTVGLGYDEESTTLSGHFADSSTSNDSSNSTSVSYLSVDPGLVYVKLMNEGTISASAELVMFSSSVSSTNAGAAIDRVHTENEQDDNTFTVTAEFQASGTDQSFCAADEGCAVYAYYLNMDEIEDAIFGTSCQAREGIKVYEGYTLGDELDETTATAVVQSTTAFEIEACVELPKDTEATYRVYVIVSPDTSTYSRVGYGLQDQLIYTSSDITVDDNMDKSCPEETAVETTSGATRVNFTPTKAFGMMVVTLAAAATRAGF